jgi:hypothetical protein
MLEAGAHSLLIMQIFSLLEATRPLLHLIHRRQLITIPPKELQQTRSCLACPFMVGLLKLPRVLANHLMVLEMALGRMEFMTSKRFH